MLNDINLQRFLYSTIKGRKDPSKIATLHSYPDVVFIIVITPPLHCLNMIGYEVMIQSQYISKI